MTCTITEHCAASYVFYNRVLDFAADNDTSVKLTLGYVMAHEIGHLMGLGHRPGGIMTAAFTGHDLQRAASGWLCFDQDDARQLRAVLARSLVASNSGRLIRLPGGQGQIAE